MIVTGSISFEPVQLGVLPYVPIPKGQSPTLRGAQSHGHPKYLGNDRLAAEDRTGLVLSLSGQLLLTGVISMDEIRLLIASDDSSARRGLAAIFASENAFQVLGSFALDDAVNKSAALQPDAVLIDIPRDLPVQGNGDRINRMKHECPCSLVVALVENDHPDRLAAILALGIDSCIPKNMMRGCLVKTIELTCRTGILCLPGSFKKVVSSSNPQIHRHVAHFNNRTVGNGEALTRREMEILKIMAGNYSNREIASKLFISEPTVKTHVSSILRKLGKSNRAQAVVYSYQVGLVNESYAVHE